MMSSTTHLSIKFLNRISLVLSSLMSTNLFITSINYLYSLLSELVHLLFSVVTTSLYNYGEQKVSYSKNIHHVLFIRKETSNFTNEFTNILHSLRSMLQHYQPQNKRLLSQHGEEQPFQSFESCDPFPYQQQYFPKDPSQ